MQQLIQIGNLADSVDSHGLAMLFAVHGNVRSATINTHFETGRSTGVGVVEMESHAGGTAAIAALHHREHCGRVLSVCWSNSAKNRDADRQQMFGPMNMISDDVTHK